jgi:PAS domain S-box-containing protein
MPRHPAGKARPRILLVDDTPDNLVSLEAALQGLDQEIVLASSGTEALRHLLESDFAAILLDVKMPDMDGFETAELIRSRPRSSQTPILFLTGYRNEDHLFRGYDLGAVDFLFKPIVPEILRSKVSVFVELSRKAELLREQTEALQRQTEILQRAELRFRSLLEAAPDAMVICTADGTIQLVNSRTEKMFERNKPDLLGRNIRELVPAWNYEDDEDDDDDAPLMLRRAAKEKEMLAKRRGSVFPVEISVASVASEEGLLITSAIRDITERKRIESERHIAEEQVRELNATLEARVLQRTEELLRSNDELAQFAYVASHDLQEPLRVVSIYTELLAQRCGGTLGEEADQFIRFILSSARRMQVLIRDLLDFSKLDARRSDYFVVTQCTDVLAGAIENLSSRIDKSGAVIEQKALPAILGDPIQLTRLFQNLIANAIKFRSRAEPLIRISAEERNGEWLFSVSDNGIGIDPRYSERIFGIFRQLEPKGEDSGNGMGLAICRKIVAVHGGRIWVESEPGRGATFHFTLPRLDV